MQFVTVFRNNFNSKIYNTHNRKKHTHIKNGTIICYSKGEFVLTNACKDINFISLPLKTRRRENIQNFSPLKPRAINYINIIYQ